MAQKYVKISMKEDREAQDDLDGVEGSIFDSGCVREYTSARDYRYVRMKQFDKKVEDGFGLRDYYSRGESWAHVNERVRQKTVLHCGEVTLKENTKEYNVVPKESVEIFGLRCDKVILSETYRVLDSVGGMTVSDDYVRDEEYFVLGGKVFRRLEDVRYYAASFVVARVEYGMMTSEAVIHATLELRSLVAKECG